MATSEIGILISLKDNASKALGAFSTKLEDLESTFKTVGVVGAAAFGAITVIGLKSLKSFQEAETAARQLEHAVLNVTKGTQAQLKATNDLADALERKGVLDGDSIKVGLAQLSTFGLSNDAVQALGGSLADLAVNQFGVNASGQQLSDTANTIAKALNGQFGVLEKSGIRFTETQRKMIEFGTEMEKVTAINEGFAQNLKFTNEVALTTMEGKIAKLKVGLDNVSTSIGSALAPALTALVAQVSPVIDNFNTWAENNPQLIQNLLLAGAAISGVMVAIDALGLVLPSVITGFAALTSPVGLIIVGLSLAVGAVVYFRNELGALFLQLDEKTGLISLFRLSWEKIVQNFNEYLLPALKELWEALVPLSPYLAAMATIIGGVLVIAIAGLVLILEGLATMLTHLLTILVQVATYIVDKIVAAFQATQKAVEGVINAVEKAISAFQRLNVVQGAKNIGSSILGSAKKAIGVNDAIISPNGNVITTNPKDYLIATTNPHGLVGAGGNGLVINFMGPVYTGPEYAREMGHELALEIKRQIRI